MKTLGFFALIGWILWSIDAQYGFGIFVGVALLLAWAGYERSHGDKGPDEPRQNPFDGDCG